MASLSDQKLKIATWNLGRPRSSTQPKTGRILEALKTVDADVWVLTETNSCIDPGEEYVPFPTAPLIDSPSTKGEGYESGENRVTIWSKKDLSPVLRLDCCSSESSICVGINTPLGELNIYGTVIGIYGRGGEEFDSSLKEQITDWQRLPEFGDFCIAGDFNNTLEDNIYFNKHGRKDINSCFQSLNIKVPTRHIPGNIDHVAISGSFLKSVGCTTDAWNKDEDTNISDHKGVWVTLTRLE